MQSKDKGLWCGLEWNHPGPKYERPRVFVWSQQANTASKATPTGTLIKIEGWVRHQQLLLGLGLNSLCDNVKAWAFWQKNPRRHRKVQQVEILRAHRHYCTDHPSLPPPLCASMISTMVKAPRRKNTTCQHLSRRRVEKKCNAHKSWKRQRQRLRDILQSLPEVREHQNCWHNGQDQLLTSQDSEKKSWDETSDESGMSVWHIQS